MKNIFNIYITDNPQMTRTNIDRFADGTSIYTKSCNIAVITVNL